MMTSKHPFINTPEALGPSQWKLDSKQSTGTTAHYLWVQHRVSPDLTFQVCGQNEEEAM